MNLFLYVQLMCYIGKSFTQNIILNKFALCHLLDGWPYLHIFFKLRYLENSKSKQHIYFTFFQEYLISFLVIRSLIDFAHLVPLLLVFKVYGSIWKLKNWIFQFFKEWKGYLNVVLGHLQLKIRSQLDTLCVRIIHC